MNSSKDHTPETSDTRSQAAQAGDKAAASLPAVPVLQQQTDQGEEPLQGMFITQLKELAPLQFKTRPAVPAPPLQRRENKTGLPDQLKSGVEQLSGTDLSDVKVHYGSSQPAQFDAYAYAQGPEIHIAPGQEQHLPHEAWHVAQQKQGRVQPTTQMKGVGVNDDSGLESEADAMGLKAMQLRADTLSSGYEHFKRSDIGDIRSQTEGTPALQQVNSEIAGANTRVAITQLVAGRFIVDDGEPLREGQVHKSTFLASVRAEVQQLAKDILEPVGLAQNDCPDLNYWIGFYNQKDAAHFEASVARYAPATQEAVDHTSYLSLLTERVKQGLIQHVATGSHEVEPGEPPAELEEKRPDPSILTMQRMEAPMQFGVCGSKEKRATPAVRVAALNSELVAASRQPAAESKCLALCAMYGYHTASQVIQDESTNLTANITDAKTDDGRRRIFTILSACGHTQMAVIRRLLSHEEGTDVHFDFNMQEGKMNERQQAIADRYKNNPKGVLDESNLAAAELEMSKPGKLILFSASGEHTFTVAVIPSSAAASAAGSSSAAASGGDDKEEVPMMPLPAAAASGQVMSGSTRSGGAGEFARAATPDDHAMAAAATASGGDASLTLRLPLPGNGGATTDNKSSPSAAPLVSAAAAAAQPGDNQQPSAAIATPTAIHSPAAAASTGTVVDPASVGLSLPVASGDHAAAAAATATSTVATGPPSTPLPIASAVGGGMLENKSQAASIAATGMATHSAAVAAAASGGQPSPAPMNATGIGDEKDPRTPALMREFVVLMDPENKNPNESRRRPLNLWWDTIRLQRWATDLRGKISDELKAERILHRARATFEPGGSPVAGYLTNPAAATGPLCYFLYQGWVDQHTILDQRFTRQLTHAEFLTFLGTLVDDDGDAKGAAASFVLTPPKPVRYKVYDL